MNISTRFLIALATISCVLPALAQPNPYAIANSAVQISQARQANAALMHQYTWNSRTEIIVQGQVQDVRIDQVSFGPFGQLQRTLLNDQPDASGPMLPTPIGFLRSAIASNEKQGLRQLSDLVRDARAHLYARSIAAQRKAVVPGRLREGVTRIVWGGLAAKTPQ